MALLSQKSGIWEALALRHTIGNWHRDSNLGHMIPELGFHPVQSERRRAVFLRGGMAGISGSTGTNRSGRSRREGD